VGADDVAIAHVGDSRAYCFRDGQLQRLTDDHSLVDELMRQGRLTPEEALEHPQRSVITRALGPEGMVEVDTRSVQARSGDVYLLCSDGLTTMIGEQQIEAVLLANPRLRDAGEALITAANEAGGRDNITVVLLRLEDVQVGQGAAFDEHTTMVGLPVVPPPAVSPPAVPPPAGSSSSIPTPGFSTAAMGPPTDSTPRPSRRRTPRAAQVSASGTGGRKRRRLRHGGALVFLATVLVVLGAGAYLAFQSVYFIGTNNRGLVTIFEGLPYRLPGNLALYSSQYVSGVSASTLSAEQRHSLLDHSLRSEGNAAARVHSLELEQLE